MKYSQSVALPTEFRLAVACCRWAFSGTGADMIVRCARGVDWQRFVAVARRHRIEGLVWHSLDSIGVAVPGAMAQNLSASARSIADDGLRAAAESARLLQAFDAAQIDLLFIKGLTVGKLAYRNPFLKMSWDLDVLVPLARIGDTAALLEKIGYWPALPAAAEPRKLAAWHRRFKESVWVNRGKRLHLELHGRLAENPRLIPDIGIDSPRQPVEVATGIVLPTLARDELFAYLCVHGMASGWHRLKWLADLAALLDGLSEQEICRLYASSQALGSGRAAGQALLLAHLLFEIDIGGALARQLERDRVTRWLVRIALAQMAGRHDLKEPTEVWFGTLTIHLSQLLLAPGWLAAAKEATRRTGVIFRNAAARSVGRTG